jgi:cell wall assembly regulator SMI1
MGKRTYHVSVLPFWETSDDVLLKALVANGGELYSALEAVKGQVRKEKRGATAIWLRYCRITDEGIEALAGLTEVKEFESSQRMIDASLVYLRGMVKMERLTLNDMRVIGDGLRHLAEMSQLKALQICGCMLTDVALSHLPVLPALTMFNLSSSTGCTDAGLECLTRLESLEHFSPNGPPIASPGLRHLAALRSLRHLDLSGATERVITDDTLAYLPELRSVEYLGLRYTHVTDAGLAHLAWLPGLKHLNLEWTGISDAGIRHLAALPNLESVNLNQTKVTLRGVRELQAARPGIAVSAHDCTGEPSPEPQKLELIRRSDHREAAPVARSWARIERWFAANLPFALETIRPPAAEADLDELEKRIGRPLPADFRASYLIHDGQDRDTERWGYGVIFGLYLRPIADGEGIRWLYVYRVEHEWPEKDNRMLDWKFHPPGAIRDAWSGPGWVPFYWDVGRNFIGIDLDPGPNGVVGQVIPFGSEDEFRPVLALSFAHLLEDVADELEAGHATVEPPEVSQTPFGLKGAPNNYFCNAYKEWAEAKLPVDFQQATAPPGFVPEDHITAVAADLAEQLVGILREFLEAMNEYERRWLAVRPILDYGVSDITEWGPKGNLSWSQRGPNPGERPANQVQEILWDEKAMHDEKTEALEVNKYWHQATAEKRKIWRRFLTSEKRPGSRCFHQQDPPYYNPLALVDPEVRLVEPGHAIITFGQPGQPGMCGGSDRLRYHLRLVGRRWRIERHELVDDPAKPWKLDLL